MATVAIAATLTLSLPALRQPSLVARLTVVNPTGYVVSVEVSSPGEEGWTDLGTVGPRGALTVEEVIDQGDRWSFRLTRAGLGSGRLVMPRDALARAGWRLDIPPGLLALRVPLPRSPALDSEDAPR
ncbi:MAG: hypothetical protein LC799_19940 [Actinobacteria bacterium]|nr:hypothetical protein [Actinomycetota bacterium]